MCRNFFPGISGGVLTPPLDPPLRGPMSITNVYMHNVREINVLLSIPRYSLHPSLVGE